MSLLQDTGNQTSLALFMQWIVSKLPPRLKRIVFIGMMMGYFNQKNDPDRELIKKINDTFRLADDPKAYEFPIAIKSIIWKDFNLHGALIETKLIDGKLLLTTESKTSICTHITDTLPTWIRYATPARIYRDTMVLINQIEDDVGGLALHA